MHPEATAVEAESEGGGGDGQRETEPKAKAAPAYEPEVISLSDSDEEDDGDGGGVAESGRPEVDDDEDEGEGEDDEIIEVPEAPGNESPGRGGGRPAPGNQVQCMLCIIINPSYPRLFPPQPAVLRAHSDVHAEQGRAPEEETFRRCFPDLRSLDRCLAELFPQTKPESPPPDLTLPQQTSSQPHQPPTPPATPPRLPTGPALASASQDSSGPTSGQPRLVYGDRGANESSPWSKDFEEYLQDVLEGMQKEINRGGRIACAKCPNWVRPMPGSSAPKSWKIIGNVKSSCVMAHALGSDHLRVTVLTCSRCNTTISYTKSTGAKEHFERQHPGEAGLSYWDHRPAAEERLRELLPLLFPTFARTTRTAQPKRSEPRAAQATAPEPAKPTPASPNQSYHLSKASAAPPQVLLTAKKEVVSVPSAEEVAVEDGGLEGVLRDHEALEPWERALGLRMRVWGPLSRPPTCALADCAHELASARASDLEAHVQSHFRKVLFVCEECCGSFADRASLAAHPSGCQEARMGLSTKFPELLRLLTACFPVPGDGTKAEEAGAETEPRMASAGSASLHSRPASPASSLTSSVPSSAADDSAMGQYKKELKGLGMRLAKGERALCWGCRSEVGLAGVPRDAMSLMGAAEAHLFRAHLGGQSAYRCQICGLHSHDIQEHMRTAEGHQGRSPALQDLRPPLAASLLQLIHHCFPSQPPPPPTQPSFPQPPAQPAFPTGQAQPAFPQAHFLPSPFPNFGRPFPQGQQQLLPQHMGQGYGSGGEPFHGHGPFSPFPGQPYPAQPQPYLNRQQNMPF